MTISLDQYEDELDNINAMDPAMVAAILAKQQNIELQELPSQMRGTTEKTSAVHGKRVRPPEPGFNDRLPSSKQVKRNDGHPGIAKIAANNAITSPRINLGSIYDIAGAPSGRALQDIDKLEKQINAAMAGHSMEEIDESIDFFEQTQENLKDQLPNPPDVTDLSTKEIVVQAAPISEFPNLAREIMDLGLKMEAFQTQNKLNKYKKEVDECKQKIDQLLKMSALLPKMNSDDSPYELKQETQTELLRIAEELKALGIDIFPGVTVGGELTKEQLAAANSLINHHIDMNRTTIQEIFTTKISVSLQFLQMMTEVMKKVADLHRRQIEKALEIVR
jgi:hypothetical protein